MVVTHLDVEAAWMKLLAECPTPLEAELAAVHAEVQLWMSDLESAAVPAVVCC